MGRNRTASASAEATSKEVKNEEVVKTEEVVETTNAVETTKEVEAEEVVETTKEVETTEEVQAENNVEVLSSNIFVAEDGTEVEFAVKHFIHSKRKYTVEEAVAEIPEALQELYERKSFIFKKV